MISMWSYYNNPFQLTEVELLIYISIANGLWSLLLVNSRGLKSHSCFKPGDANSTYSTFKKGELKKIHGKP